MNFLQANNVASLKDYILEKGPYSPKENLRIYEKWFAPGPRYLFQAVNKKYGLTGKVLADVGCAYGVNLIHCTPESYGIEIEEYEVRFARALGLTVYERNVLDDSLADLPKADAVWCSAVLEHVDSPHIFLRKLHSLLKPEGLVCIFVPTIPLMPWLKHLPRVGHYFKGHVHGDHINAYIPETLRFFGERAGFKTVEASPFLPGLLGVFNRIPLLQRLIDGCIYVGRKIEGWNYPPGSTRQAVENVRGYEFIGQPFPESNAVQE